MKKFNRADWDNLMNRIKDMNIQTLAESQNKQKGNIVNIRHDIDDDLMASVDMARAENLMGIRSTYYVLDTAPYWESVESDYYFRLIYDMNHEIGWHNNALTNHYKTGKPLVDCIMEPLERLRRVAKVTGTASHGDPLCHEKGYLNYYAFRKTQLYYNFPNVPDDQFTLKEFGLHYEAYHTGFTHYISDSGGNFYGKIGDQVTTMELALEDFEKNGGKLQILLHPQWWSL